MKRVLQIIGLLAVLLTLSVPPNSLHAEEFEVILTTGVDVDGALIETGEDDDDWVLVESPEGITPRAATVMDEALDWLTFTGSKWISSDESGGGDVGDFVFEFTFDLPADATDVSLDGFARTDNEATILLNGTVLASPVLTSYEDDGSVISTSDIGDFLVGENTLRCEVYNSGGPTGLSVSAEVSYTRSQFKRGDADGSGEVEPLSDAIYLLAWAFQGGDDPPCRDAADVDGDDHAFALVDALALLSYAFGGGDVPPDPGPTECGIDPGDDEEVGCAQPPECE